MPTCPEGHDTPSTDFCDVCGIRIGAPAAQAQAGAAAGACPRCGADRRLQDGDRVCLGAWTMLTIQAA